MENNTSWILTEKEKDKLISALAPALVVLRTKAGLSQEELSALIGVSRQTYGSVERLKRKMSWNTFLSLIMFYDYNQKTHEMLRTIGAFPYEIIKHFNDGKEMNNIDLSVMLDDKLRSIVDCLDEQALRSIKTLIMVEYARCTDTPGDVVVRSFDGKVFNLGETFNPQATQALKAIKEQNNKK